MDKTDLTAERLRDYLQYDPKTGNFIWIPCPGRRVGRSKPNMRAGTVNVCGYVQISLRTRLYYAHRLAWLYMTGEWPSHSIDHIDGERANNAWANLRESPGGINQQNIRMARSHNKSGLLGVQKNKNGGGWSARITADHKRITLGTFETPEEAHQVYLAAKRRLHPGNTL